MEDTEQDAPSSYPSVESYLSSSTVQVFAALLIIASTRQVSEDKEAPIDDPSEDKDEEEDEVDEDDSFAQQHPVPEKK